MKVKLFLLLPLSFVFILGCKSASRQLELGNYDSAISQSVKTLHRNPSKTKAFSVLQQAYELANFNDNEHIKALKKEGDPSLWEEIYYTYVSLDYRDKKIGELPDSLFYRIIPNPVDYSADMENAKLNATKFLYEIAMQLLSTNTKVDAQTAYNCLLSVQKFYPNYKDVEEQLVKARIMGTVQVLIRINNSYQWQSLPFEAKNVLSSFNTMALNKEWVIFSTTDNLTTTYDYYLDLFFDWSIVLPMDVDNRNYTIAKDITEIKKINDSTEREEKITVECKVSEFQQRKVCKMRASLELININANQIAYSAPITAEFVFANQWAIAKGDVRALSDRTLALLGQKALPEPPDTYMLVGVSQVMLNEVQREIEYCSLHKIE